MAFSDKQGQKYCKDCNYGKPIAEKKLNCKYWGETVKPKTHACHVFEKVAIVRTRNVKKNTKNEGDYER